MKRIGLIVLLVIILLIVGFVSWLGATASGLQWAYLIARSYIPPQVSIAQVDGRLIGPLNISGLSYLAADGSRVQLEQASLRWKPLSLLSGIINIQSLQAEKLDIEQASASSEQSSTLTLPNIKLPLQLRIDDLQIKDINLTRQQQSYHIARLQLKAATLFDQVTLQQASLDAQDIHIDLNGTVRVAGNYKHKLNLHWRYLLASNRFIEGNGDLVGDLDSTELKHNVDGAISLQLDARLKQVLTQLSWQADVNIKRFNSQLIDPALPDLKGQMSVAGSGSTEQANLKGNMQASNAELGEFASSFDISAAIDKPVQIRQLSLIPAGGVTRVNAEGNWTPGGDGGQVDLKLNWKHLKWPLSGDSWFDSSVGQGSLSGSLENYHFNLQTDRPWAQIPVSQWDVSGQGDLTGLSLSKVNIKTLQGEINGQGKVSWKDTVKWDATIDLQDINPASEWPDWPGKLAASLVTSGSYQHDKLLLQGDITKLSGVLRDYPITANGKLKWLDQQLDIDHLKVVSGDSRIALTGRYAEQMDLQWSIDSANLAELYPDTQGRIKAQGKIQGTREKPVVDGRFNGQQLIWKEIKIGALKGNTRLDITQWYQAEVNLEAHNIVAASVALDDVVISTSSDAINASLKTAWAHADIGLRGGVTQDRWQGEIIRADIQGENISSWKIVTPARLILGSDIIDLQKLCWHNEKKSTICSRLSQQGKQYQSHIDLKQVALSLLKPWLPEGLRAEGVANADAELSLDEAQNLNGQVKLILPEGVIHYPLADGQKQNWSYRNGLVDLLADESGISIKSSLLLNQSDSLLVDATLPRARVLNLTQDQAIQGEARLDIRDIHLLESLIPEVQDAQGEIQIRLQSRGTLNRPGLKGFVSLDGGSFKVPRLGLDISKVSLSGKSDNLDQMQLELKAHSGEGDISVNGVARLTQLSDWSSEFKLSGQNFEVSRIPEASVRVSPQLTINVKPGNINISGNVHVPYARLNPKDVSSAVQVSDDVVIVGKQQTPQRKWTITTHVRVTLDPDHVHFFGYGFEGDIGGNLLLEDQPGQLTRAIGEIKIPNGRYRAYGQRLDIENGRLIFSGGPISNPGLDFRAKRVINDVTAGVYVTGTLLKPKLELYSIPAMGQTDALAYLILGRPMESTSNQDGEVVAKAALALGLSGGDRIARMLQDQFGLDEMRVESSNSGDQASLVVGRYLSPKLYVSYGVGLIESINTFSLRYQLSDKWQLKAESGETQSADIFYTIER